MFLQTGLHVGCYPGVQSLKCPKIQECHHHAWLLLCLEVLLMCLWSPSVHCSTLLHFMALITLCPSWRVCCHMEKSRNTGDLICQVPCGFTGVYPELVLLPSTIIHWCWLEMFFRGGSINPCYLEKLVCGGYDRMTQVVVHWRWKVCSPAGWSFWHWCWSVGCTVHWVSKDCHHWSWWIPGSGVWGCNICVCEVKTLDAALELLLIDQSLPDWRINPPPWRHGRFSGLCWVGLECRSFHSHSHYLHPPVQVQFQMHHSEGHNATKQYSFWYISYLLCIVTIDRGSIELIYGVVEDVWFKVCCPELKCCACGIPYGIFTCKRPTLQGIHGVVL